MNGRRQAYRCSYDSHEAGFFWFALVVVVLFLILFLLAGMPFINFLRQIGLVMGAAG